MKLFLLKLPILFGFIVAACGTQDSVNLPVSDSAESYQKLAEAPSTEQPAPPAEFSERKIIREGDIYFECRDIQETDAFLKAEVNAAKGFISNESENSYGERSEKRLTIRIPSDQLDPLLEKNPIPCHTYRKFQHPKRRRHRAIYRCRSPAQDQKKNSKTATLSSSNSPELWTKSFDSSANWLLSEAKSNPCKEG